MPRVGTRAALFACALLSCVRLASASGLDGAGHVLIVPLVFAGSERMSHVTITNPGSENVRVHGSYVGAEGTPLAASRVGVLACPEQLLAPDESRTQSLRDFCPDVRPMDLENFGYLELVSEGDARFTILATSTVPTTRGTTFGVAADPVGAFDPGQRLGQPSLRAIGLRGTLPGPGQSRDETLACYFASLDEAKKLELLLWDASGGLMASGLTVTLDPRRMQRLDLLSAFGLPAGSHEGLRLEVASADPALVVGGCGLELRASATVAYQPLQTPDPLDRARLRSAFAETEVTPGPYHIGYIWTHTLAGGSANRKVTLSTYLRPDDRVRCFLEQPSIYTNFDPRPWLELQVRDPKNVVVAGGDRALDTGAFSTGPRGRYPAAAGLRWHVDVSFDEATGAWPHSQLTGGWAVRCLSATGMSALLPVDDPTSSDNF